MDSTPSLAKITAPRVHDVYLRDRLFKELDAARKNPIIWISAPAGSGKTTLVVSYLQEKKIEPLWYQVDAGDSDVASFFYYMGEAEKHLNPHIHKPLPLFTPEYLLGLVVFCKNFFRALFQRMEKSGLLVLDNYQDAGSEVALHEVLVNGLAEIPQGINVIVISRSDPPALFARLITHHEIKLINWEQINLTQEESVGISTLRAGNDEMSQEVIQHIHNITQGWVAGVVLLLEGVSDVAASEFVDKDVNSARPKTPK